MSALKKLSLVDMVYKQLRNEIISLKRPLGSHLNVNDLQNEYSVSCTPIREAINRLQQEGIITYRNNSGADIFTLDSHDIVEIQQVALSLHCTAMCLTIDNANMGRFIPELEKRIKEYDTVDTPNDEVASVIKIFTLIYHSCGNARLDKSMLNIQAQQLILRTLYYKLKDPGKDTRYFREMLEAFRLRDKHMAVEVMSEYVNQMTVVLLKKYKPEH